MTYLLETNPVKGDHSNSLVSRRVPFLNMKATTRGNEKEDLDQRIRSGLVKAGMERARRQGKQIGRPGVPDVLQELIRAIWIEEKAGVSEIARRLKMPVSTVHKYVSRFRDELDESGDNKECRTSDTRVPRA